MGEYKGKRNPDLAGKWNVPRQAGLMSEGRQAWVTLPKFDAILFIGGETVAKFDPDTPPVGMEFRIPGRRTPFKVSLTEMTADELTAFKEFLDHAVNKAMPICQKLDERAQEAFRNGEDGFTRLYRPVPKFFDRERLVEEHRQGLPERPERLVDRVPPEEVRDVYGPADGGSGHEATDVHQNGDRSVSGRAPDPRPLGVDPGNDESEAGGTS